jgi:hypothetical protein
MVVVRMEVGVMVGGHRSGVLRHQCPGSECREPVLDPGEQAFDGFGVGSGETQDRATAAGLLALADHQVRVDAHVRREIGLVDDEQIGSRDPRTALTDDIAAAGDIEDEDLDVHERGGEGGGEVVAAGLDEDQVDGVEVGLEVLDGQEVRRDVVADRGVRAGAGLDAADPFRCKHSRAAEHPRVLVGVDVVGDNREREVRSELAAEQGDQRRLAGPDRTADAEAERSSGSRVGPRIRHGTTSDRPWRGPRPRLRSAAPTTPGSRRGC